jgi:hypothetical protein
MTNDPWQRPPTNRADAAWLVIWRIIIPPKIRSRLRHHGHERLALWLDRLCREDTP